MVDHRLVRLTGTIAVCMFALWAPELASAQDQTNDAIVACMIEKTTEADKQALKKLIVAALTDDNDGTKKYVLQAGFAISDLALNKCHMSYDLLSKPAFKSIANAYGQKLGEMIMKEAFSKLK